jgi:hypothetical protein
MTTISGKIKLTPTITPKNIIISDITPSLVGLENVDNTTDLN